MDTRQIGTITQGTILYQGRYRIDLLLTRTPHRAIYRAWDLSRNRAASIVEYAPSDDATVTVALERAAPLVQLDHHSLMAFQVVFVEHDTVFAALTFAGGQTIEHIMAERATPIPPAAAVRWISQTAEMLEFLASALPTWHLGDLSGGALFVTAEDRAQPLSFEIPLGLLTPAQVAADLPVGSIAPELSPGQCDARSDVYSLAATLHLLLTRQAWAGGDPAANTALDTVQPALARPLIDAVRRGLSLDPTNRWSDIAAFHGALLSAMATPAEPTAAAASIFPGIPAQPLHEEPATLATPRDALRNAVAAEAAQRGETLPPWLHHDPAPEQVAPAEPMIATEQDASATTAPAPEPTAMADLSPVSEQHPVVDDAATIPVDVIAPVATAEVAGEPPSDIFDTLTYEPLTPVSALEPASAAPESAVAATEPSQTPVATEPEQALPVAEAVAPVSEAAPPAQTPPAAEPDALPPTISRANTHGVVPAIEGAFAIFGRRAAEPSAPTSDMPSDASTNAGEATTTAQPSQTADEHDGTTVAGEVQPPAVQDVAHNGAAMLAQPEAASATEPQPQHESGPSPLIPIAAAATGAALIAAIGSRFMSLPALKPMPTEPEAANDASPAAPEPVDNATQTASDVVEHSAPAGVDDATPATPEETDAPTPAVSEVATDTMPATPEVTAEPTPAVPEVATDTTLAMPESQHDAAQTEPAPSEMPIVAAAEAVDGVAQQPAEPSPVAGVAAREEPTDTMPQREALGSTPASETVSNALWGNVRHDALDNLAPALPIQPEHGLADMQAILPEAMHSHEALHVGENAVVPAPQAVETATPQDFPARVNAPEATPATQPLPSPAQTAPPKPAGPPAWGTIAAAGAVGVVGSALWAQHEERARQKEAETQQASLAQTPSNNGALSEDAAAISSANAGTPHYDDSDWLNFGSHYADHNTSPAASATTTPPPATPPAEPAFTTPSADATQQEMTPNGTQQNGHDALANHARATDAEIIAAALGGSAALGSLASAHDAPTAPAAEQVITAHPDAPAPAKMPVQAQVEAAFAPTHSPNTTPLASKTPSRPLMERIRQILQPQVNSPAGAIGTIVVPRHMYAHNTYSILVRLQVRAVKKPDNASTQSRPMAFVEVEATPDDAFYLPVRRLALPIPIEGGLSEGSLSVTAQRPTPAMHDRLTFTFKLADGTVLHKGQFVADISILGPQQIASGDTMLTLIHPLEIA